MGLDMYLTKEIYIGAEYAHRKVTGVVDIQINGEPVNIQFNKIQSIIESVGYWRKANAIHKWFVDNVQEGEDDCKTYWVSCGHLTKLLQDVTKVLDNHQLAKEILPAESGFFFGPTDYDD